MAKTTTTPTGRARLCALGEYLRRHCCFAPLRDQVQIPQKTVRSRPIEQVLDGLLGILCGAKTLSQSNGTIRVEQAGQRAFGRAVPSNRRLPVPCRPVPRRRWTN